MNFNKTTITGGCQPAAAPPIPAVSTGASARTDEVGEVLRPREGPEGQLLAMGRRPSYHRTVPSTRSSFIHINGCWWS